MYISIFSDELAMDVTKGLPIIKSWGLDAVDFRGRIFGKAIEKLNDTELKQLRTLVDENEMSVGCLQSSLAKVHWPDANRQKEEAEKLEGLIRAADALDCRLVRSFFYWQPPKEEQGRLAIQPDVLQKTADMFAPLAERARAAELAITFENCGVTPDEVFAMLDILDVPEWGMAWDVANTWICDERKTDEEAYIRRMLARSKLVHVKANGCVVPQDDDLIPYAKVLKACHDAGIRGPVSVETHNADKSITDEEQSRRVVEAVRRAWPPAASTAKGRPVEAIKRDWHDQPVGFLVVGLGMGHENSKKVMAASGCKLVGVADLVEERARRSGEEFDVPFTTDYRSMLDRDDVEVVYVVTETGNHAEVALEALKAGKHVLTTKPMEATLAACDEMLACSKEKQVLLGVDFGSRFQTIPLTLKKAVADGFFGDLLSGECFLKILRTMAYFKENGGWRGTRKLDGGGVFSNQAIHHIDQLAFTVGVPSRVRASLWTQTHEIEAEDLSSAVWEYENGMVITLGATSSYPQATWYTRVELAGRDGAYAHAHGGPFGKGWTKWYKDGEWSEEGPTEVKSEWLNAPDNFAAAVRVGAPLVCDGQDARRSQSILDAMYRSAYESDGGWVEVNRG